MSASSARLALIYSSMGHSFAHLFEPIYFIVALSLPQAMGISYQEALGLIVVGKLLYGFGAPFMGFFSDRWSTTGMMVVYFLGLGVSAVGAGLARTPFEISLALSLVGLFGGIYHPVGISWLVRNAKNHGQALGINGLFGALGAAVAGMIAGLLIDWQSWRAALIIPGIVVIATGLAFTLALWQGKIVETRADLKPMPAPSRGEIWKIGLITALAMLGAGLVYQATQASLPKLFNDKIDFLQSFGTSGVGGAVMAVYLLASLLQIPAGKLADNFGPRTVYITVYILQIPLLVLAAFLDGGWLLLVAALMVSLNLGGIPAENVLLARYTPANWRGAAFGLKYILSFGVSGLGVPLAAMIYARNGNFFWLMIIMAASAVMVTSLALLLPKENKV